MGLLSILALLVFHPIEFITLLRFKLFYKQRRDITAKNEHPTTGWDRKSMRRCWELLDMTSRSFSVVIKELEGDLARVVCLFYLVLRGLDTIEDDMTIPDHIKQPILRSFHIHTFTPGWNFTGCGPAEKDRQLLVEYDTVIEEVNSLPPAYKSIIADICLKMETGMADYAHKAATATENMYLDTIAEYDLYCLYAGGLVGEGMSRVFAASGKEPEWLASKTDISHSVGRFLQKSNIIRDFREDVDDHRFFWPREIWTREKYGRGPDGSVFKEMREMYLPWNERRAAWVQSEMILDALRHTEHALECLTFLRNQSVIQSIAIPITLCMATLTACFMNPEVFQRKVKVRKAEAASIIMRCTSPQEVSCMFRDYARKIRAKALPEDPNFPNILAACDKIEAWHDRQFPPAGPSTSVAHVNGEKSPSSTTNTRSGRHPATRGWMKHPSVITHICSTFLLIGLIRLAVMYGVLGLPGGHET